METLLMNHQLHGVLAMVSAVFYIILFSALATANATLSRNHPTAFASNYIAAKSYNSFATSSYPTSLPASILEADALNLKAPPSSSLTNNNLFQKTNVKSCSLPVPHPDIWKRCFDVHINASSSNPFWYSLANSVMGKRNKDTAHGIVKDVEVIFEDPVIGAHALLDKCGLITQQDNTNQPTTLPDTIMKEQETLDHLTKVLSYYQSIVSSDDESRQKSCKARIVSTVGSIGTKCPRWHADHVPVRLVMSLLGPGCEYIPFEREVCYANGVSIQVVNRYALNNLEEDDTAIANELIVPSGQVEIAQTESGEDTVRCAKAGDAVLLMGRGWENENSNVLAAVHRSPRLMAGEKRILLTVDVADWDYSHQ
jgi:hypothetical protein